MPLEMPNLPPPDELPRDNNEAVSAAGPGGIFAYNRMRGRCALDEAGNWGSIRCRNLFLRRTKLTPASEFLKPSSPLEGPATSWPFCIAWCRNSTCSSTGTIWRLTDFVSIV